MRPRGFPADSPIGTAKAALARAQHPGVALEVYVQFGRTVTVKTFGREVESIVSAEPRGVGVRAIHDHRVGYAFSADLSADGMDRVVAESVFNANATDPDPYVELPLVPSGPYPVLPGLWRPGVGSLNLDGKARLALEAEAAALAGPDVEMVEVSMYSDSEARVAIVSTEGVEAETEQSFCFVYVLAHASRGGDRQSGQGYSLGREPSELDTEAAGKEAAAKARALIGASSCPTGLYTVVFDREVAAALLSSITAALSAEAVQKGRSVFAERLGEVIASPLVTLADDGLTLEGIATSPFDGEGVPHQRTTLIEKGVLQGLLHNVYTTRKASEGHFSTGNGGRDSYRYLPGVSPTNLVLVPGRGRLDDLFGRVGEGLYAESVAGLHSGINAVSGEISLGVTGRLIEGGTLGKPVREVTIATDFISLLQSVSDLDGAPRWIPLHGSVCSPAMAVEGIAVSGS